MDGFEPQKINYIGLKQTSVSGKETMLWIEHSCVFVHTVYNRG
jgi:hypothetical protein